MAEKMVHGKKDNRIFVHKFGGTSMAETGQVADIVDSLWRRGGRHIVVVSALAGMTNFLVEVDKYKNSIDPTVARQIAHDAIFLLHYRRAVAMGLSHRELIELNSQLVKTENELAQEAGKGRLSRRDRVLAAGELGSSKLLAATLRDQGVPAVAVDSRDFLVTSEVVPKVKEEPEVIWTPTMEKGRDVLFSLLDEGIIPVVTGFIGRDSKGRTTTLGRGGSDYSFSINVRIAGADVGNIFTDVNGVYDRDPNRYPDAQLIRVMTRKRADEMARAGSKVLYPRTMMPLEGMSTRVYVRNTFDLLDPGTYIAAPIRRRYRT